MTDPYKPETIESEARPSVAPELIDPPDTTREQEQLSSFIPTTCEVAGIKLRPLGAGAMVHLQTVEHKFLNLSGNKDQVVKQMTKMKDLFEQTCQGLYILGAPIDEVSEVVLGDRKTFRKRAISFCYKVKYTELQEAAAHVFGIIQCGFRGLNYEVAGSGVPAAPNLSTRAGSRATSSASPTARDGASNISSGISRLPEVSNTSTRS